MEGSLEGCSVQGDPMRSRAKTDASGRSPWNKGGTLKGHACILQAGSTTLLIIVESGFSMKAEDVVGRTQAFVFLGSAVSPGFYQVD